MYNNTAITKFIEAVMVTSQRGNPLILYDGFTYCKTSKVRKYGQTWMCSTHGGKGCNAALIIDNNMIVTNRHQHQHPKPNYTTTAAGTRRKI